LIGPTDRNIAGRPGDNMVVSGDRG